MTKDLLKTILIIIFVTTNLITVYVLFVQKSNLTNLENVVNRQKTNTEVVVFAQMLIEKVLKSKDPVDFNTRLALENMVRDLHDQAILNEWSAFANASDSNQAQISMKNLLDLLVRKINIIN